jgi:hypothetical protein
MSDLLNNVSEWIASTKIQEQVAEVDIVGLFTNPWFLVPFVILMGFFLYKLEFKNIILVGVAIGLWWASGTEYMNTLIVDGEIQAKKVIPVVLGGACALGFLIYIYFGRSD